MAPSGRCGTCHRAASSAGALASIAQRAGTSLAAACLRTRAPRAAAGRCKRSAPAEAALRTHIPRCQSTHREHCGSEQHPRVESRGPQRSRRRAIPVHLEQIQSAAVARVAVAAPRLAVHILRIELHVSREVVAQLLPIPNEGAIEGIDAAVRRDRVNRSLERRLAIAADRHHTARRFTTFPNRWIRILRPTLSTPLPHRSHFFSTARRLCYYSLVVPSHPARLLNTPHHRKAELRRTVITTLLQHPS